MHSYDCRRIQPGRHSGFHFRDRIIYRKPVHSVFRILWSHIQEYFGGISYRNRNLFW